MDKNTEKLLSQILENTFNINAILKEIKKEISKINFKLDDLDARIYALEFYKRDLLSTQ